MYVAGSCRNGLVTRHNQLIGKVAFGTSVMGGSGHTSTPLVNEDSHKTKVAYKSPTRIINQYISLEAELLIRVILPTENYLLA
jgi:hypothetical protein